MKIIRAFASIALALAAFSQSAFAVVYPLPPANSRLIGENIEITVPEDSKLPLEAFCGAVPDGPQQYA
ncbi:Probable L,D-transpeptidase ErfK/SrfK precursor [Pantoea agglomerans]|uniref:Probable L,D-transpeptidase ErfK/SrfK n=1 Tax=Enterobacter agglomerans TaxID=549 RepID=A0A379AIU5_ENTAG|nr:Probable L,D-transpeptidase ErfK/SrfK precursor [Pantoea agglomerans]